MVFEPLSLILYTVFFIAVVLLTERRPIYGVCILVVLEPFAFYQSIFSTLITFPKVALIAVLLGLCVRPNAFAPAGERSASRILVAGVLVLAATLLSYAHAVHHGAVLREGFKAGEYIVLFCVVVSAYRADPDRVLLRTSILITALAVCALALAQEFHGAPSVLLMSGHPTPRIAGPLEGPNQLAGYFDLVLPLVFALSVDEPSPLAYAVLFFIVFTDVLTFSRGGSVGAIAGVVCVALILRRHLKAALGAIGAGALAGFGGAVSWGVLAHTIGLSRFWDFAPSQYAGGVGTRPLLWRAAIALWREHPFFGVGAGNFELELPRVGVYGIKTHANSLYLQALVEGGIPLLAATLWLIYSSIATFARGLLASPLVVAALAGTIALSLHQVVDLLVFYPKVGGEWWIVMALGAAELAAAEGLRERACV